VADHTTAFVHEFALFRRIEKETSGEHRRLCKANLSELGLLGKYYVYDFTEKQVIATHVELKRFAKDLGLLRTNEEVITDE
jgi:hypothetical protein